MAQVLPTSHKRIVQPPENHMAKLPEEVTDNILHLDVAQVKDDWLALISRREALAQVCLQWATTIDTAPHYWDTLAVKLFMNVDFMKRSVERAKSRSLTIRLFLTAKAGQYPTKLSFTRPPSREVAEFIAEILPEMAVVFPRAQNLHLQSEETADAVAVMNLVASYGLQSIKTASISSRWISSFLHDATGNAIDMPRLSTLSLTLVHPLSFGTSPLNNLAALKIRCFWSTPALRAAHFIEALGAATRLETLDLEEVQCVDVDETSAVSLPALTDFKMSYMQDQCTQVISRLQMPVLERLRVETCTGSSITSLFACAPEVISTPAKVVLVCDDLSKTEMIRTFFAMKRAVALDLRGSSFHTTNALEEVVLMPEFSNLAIEELRLPHDVSIPTIRAALSVSRQEMLLVTAATPAGNDCFRWRMRERMLVKELFADREETVESRIRASYEAISDNEETSASLQSQESTASESEE